MFALTVCLVCFGWFAVLVVVWVRGVWMKLIRALLADLSTLSV